VTTDPTNNQNQNQSYAPTGPKRRAARGNVAERRARAKHAVAQPQQEPDRQQEEEEDIPSSRAAKRRPAPVNRKTKRTIRQAIDDFLLAQESSNHTRKTLEWHRGSLGMLATFLEQERQISCIGDFDNSDIRAWLSYIQKTPGPRGLRKAHSNHTYARSVRAFCHWLVDEGYLDESPFARIKMPKYDKPVIRIIEPEEFEKMLSACVPTNESGPLVDRAIARNRAILWLLYDTGIRLAELCNLRLGDVDRRKGRIIVYGKGRKERAIALGVNCLRNFLHYLDRHRPSEEELAEWGNVGDDHVFLSETRQPLTKSGIAQIIKRVRIRAGITDKRISPHIFRHTFAVRFLMAGNDPFSLQALLGHEDLSTVLNYMHRLVQEQKRKFSPGDHLPTRMPGPKETRRQGFQPKDNRGRNGSQ